MKRPERPERRVVEQFGPEQGRPDAVVDPDAVRHRAYAGSPGWRGCSYVADTIVAT
jgi:hypothetical protein